MKILILPDREAAVAACVDLIAQTLTATPDAVLGLATGGTREPVYAGLLARARAGEHLFASAKALAANYPDLTVIPVCADYTRPFALPATAGEGARTGFFPGCPR